MSYLNPYTFEDSYILPTSSEKAFNSPFFSELVTAIVLVSLGKTPDAYFSLGPSSLPAVVAQPEERLANRTQKSARRHRRS